MPTRTPRVGMIHPGLFCVIRTDGHVTMFTDRLQAIRWLRVEALERGRATQDRRRRAQFEALCREVREGDARLPVRRFDDVWAEVLATDPRTHVPTRAGGTAAK